MKGNILKYCFILVAFIFSCTKEHSCDCFKGTGDTTTEFRKLLPFNKISIENNINLYITEDTVFYMTVEAGSKLISSITSEVKDSCLYLKNENKCNWVRSFKNKINVYLNCGSLQEIKCNQSSGNVFSTNTLHSDYLQIDSWDASGVVNLAIDTKTAWFNLHTGSGDLNISGKSDVCYLYSAGNGKADLLNLTNGILYMNNKSTNNCFVNAVHELDVNIGYVGDVYYTGDPDTIITDITGSGKLIKL
jgi:hypothetical protein